MPQQFFEDFVYENDYDLHQLYTMLTNSIETSLKFEDFCRFVYKKTFCMF
jgi:hypothetical protein